MKKKLDNSAILHTAVMKEDYINVFRLSANLIDDIDPVYLQAALDKTSMKYPLLCSKIVSDFFWNYVETDTKEMEVKSDDQGVFNYLNYSNVYQNAIQVLYDKKKISMEGFHSITDGYGAIQMFNNLLSEYLFIMNKAFKADKNEIEAFDVYEDSFIKCANSNLHKRKNKSFVQNKKINITTFVFDIHHLKSIAKSHGCHITEFLSVLFFISLFEISKKQNSNKKVSLRIPINLRNIFPSRTLRNFTLCVDLEMKNHGQTIEEIILSVKQQMRSKKNKSNLLKQIKRNVAIEQSPFIRYLPLYLKHLILRSVYRIGGESNGLTISNLGENTFSHELAELIESMDLILTPRSTTPYNCGVITFQNELHLNISNSSNQFILEDVLKNCLNQMKIPFIIN